MGLGLRLAAITAGIDLNAVANHLRAVPAVQLAHGLGSERCAVRFGVALMNGFDGAAMITRMSSGGIDQGIDLSILMKHYPALTRHLTGEVLGKCFLSESP